MFGDQVGILVGMQILVKGYDLFKFMLVVVVGIDEGLFLVDFCVSEKLVQQLIQVVGWVGCVEYFGEVWLQIYYLGYFLLDILVNGGYYVFVVVELQQCEVVGFLLFVYLVLLCVEVQQVEYVNVMLMVVCVLVLDDVVIECYGLMLVLMLCCVGY